MSKRRVVVTGLGMLSPDGNTVDSTWDAIVAGQSGISLIDHFDTSAYATRFAGLVKDFNSEDYISRKDARKMDAFIQYGIAAGIQAFKDSEADYLIAIGGGSSMDTSKAIGIIIANPEFEDVRSLEGVAPTTKPCVPIIAVPTTAGTAAEVTINYVITDVEKKRKFVCVDPHDIPVIAVIDPEMMSSMPKGLTAATGMDALTHAIEGYTTKAAWEMTDMFHIKAIELISDSLRGAVENTPEGREGMAMGQYIAGMGFSNVGLGIVHSMAHALGAVYDTPHGVANAILLPTVMEYNADATGDKYKYIAKAMGVEGVEDMTQEEYRKAAVDAVKKLSADVGIPADLKEIVKEEDLQFLAESAYADACAPGNPKDASVEDLKALFRKLM